MGLVTYDGHRKAIFNAFKIYGELHERRVAVVSPIGAKGVHLLASVAARYGGLVLWNEDDVAQTIQVDFDGLPFAGGTLETYRIDAHHGSYVDDPDSESLRPCVPPVSLRDSRGSWRGVVPAHGVVYLKLVAKP